MSPPPINIDDSEITGATIDGQDVEEITVNGDVVFSVGPNFDTNVFDGSIYQWLASSVSVSDGQVPSSWTDNINSVTASTSDNPIFRADHVGFPAVEFNGNDLYTWSGGSELPQGNESFSIAATVNTDTGPTQYNAFLSWGSANFNNNSVSLMDEPSVGDIDVYISGSGHAQGGTYRSNVWKTVGVSYNPSNNELKTFVDGSNQTTENFGSNNLNSTSGIIGDWAFGGQRCNGYISEILVSDQTEPNANFSDYHTQRLG
jgi:hypothetical protein